LLGETLNANQAIRLAFRCERAATLSLRDLVGAEPTSSILLFRGRSHWRTAQGRSVSPNKWSNGLSGAPQVEIAEELRDL